MLQISSARLVLDCSTKSFQEESVVGVTVAGWELRGNKKIKLAIATLAAKSLLFLIARYLDTVPFSTVMRE